MNIIINNCGFKLIFSNLVLEQLASWQCSHKQKPAGQYKYLELQIASWAPQWETHK